MKVPAQDPVAVASTKSIALGEVVVFLAEDETAGGCSARVTSGQTNTTTSVLRIRFGQPSLPSMFLASE